MANKKTTNKNKPARKTLRLNEYYNPKTKRYEYRYKDALGKDRVISSYRLEPTITAVPEFFTAAAKLSAADIVLFAVNTYISLLTDAFPMYIVFVENNNSLLFSERRNVLAIGLIFRYDE